MGSGPTLMPLDTSPDSQLEIGHVLFIDIVGYSKLLTNEQRQLLQQLNGIVRETEPFRAAEATGKLVRLPTGDGMALAFFNSPDAPVRCAVAIGRELKKHPELKLRMGIHSGPVDVVFDVNDRPNVAGAGINMAQRVMDCADAGHILLSKRSADDLAQHGDWKRNLHELGEMEVKHGVRLEIVSFYDGEVGNPEAPEKLRRAEQARQTAATLGARRKRKRLISALAAVTIAVLLIAVSMWAWQRRAALASGYKAGAMGALEKSIAVLPFENFGADQESAYFADGVQDDILTDLAKVADLKVISRRSVAQYRGSTQSIRDIGQALRVAYVLEGTVRRIGDKISISAQLIDTRTEVEKWAEKYTRELSDLFPIQNQISETIVAQLRATLTPAEKSAIEAPPTQDMQAYDLYLQARSILYAFGVRPKVADENRPKATKLLQEAIARDPKFVLAYCLLSEAQSTPNWAEELTPGQIATAKATAETAVRLSPQSGEARLALGAIYYWTLHDPARGVEEFTVAARTMPNSVDILSVLGQVATDRGQWKQALQDREKAARLDPRDPDVALNLIGFYIALRRYHEAELLIDRMLAILPPESTMNLWAEKSEIAVARGDLKAAMTALEASPNQNTGSPSHNYRIATLLLMQRHYAEAETLIQEIPERARKGNVLPRSGLNPFAQGLYAQTLGIAFRAQGDAKKARAAFEITRAGMQKWLKQRPEEPPALAMLAQADAGCARKDETLREAQTAMQTWPLSREPLRSASMRQYIAVAYSWLSQPGDAIQLLKELVQLPCDLTAGDLKLHPRWDELRQDPRFAGLVDQLAEPVKIE